MVQFFCGGDLQQFHDATMKLFLFVVPLVVVLAVDFAAPWPYSNEVDNDDDGGDSDDNGVDERGGDDEAFLTGTNRTYTFGECSSFEGQPPHMELVTSRCGSTNVYYSSTIFFRVTTPSSSFSSDPCCGRRTVAMPPCLLACVKALDLKGGGSAKANVTVLEGGVGRDFIRFRVDGELGKGYYYLMQGFTNCTGVVWTRIHRRSAAGGRACA